MYESQCWAMSSSVQPMFVEWINECEVPSGPPSDSLSKVKEGRCRSGCKSQGLSSRPRPSPLLPVPSCVSSFPPWTPVSTLTALWARNSERWCWELWEGRIPAYTYILEKEEKMGQKMTLGSCSLGGRKKSHEGIKYKEPGDSVLNKTFPLHLGISNWNHILLPLGPCPITLSSVLQWGNVNFTDSKQPMMGPPPATSEETCPIKTDSISKTPVGHFISSALSLTCQCYLGQFFLFFWFSPRCEI